MCPAMIIPIDRLLLSTSSKLDRLAISSLPLPHSQETDSDSAELSQTAALSYDQCGDRLFPYWRKFFTTSEPTSTAQEEISRYSQSGSAL